MLTKEEKRVVEVVEKSPQNTPYSWAASTLKILIKNEVEKYVISKCSEELEPGEMLVVNIEVGDRPAEEIQNILNGLKDKFKEAGITHVIFVATRHGEGIVTLNKIKDSKKGK